MNTQKDAIILAQMTYEDDKSERERMHKRQVAVIYLENARRIAEF